MKKFSTSLSGYNKKEVNQFTATVYKEYESMLNNLKARDKEIEELKNKLLKYQTMENTLNRAILIAEDTSNQIKRMARDESKSIVDDAKRNASRIVNDALVKAQKLENDANELRRRIIMFKKRFRNEVELELEAIDSINENL